MKVFLSILLTILLTVSLLLTGLIKPIVDFFSVDQLSAAISNTVKKTITVIKDYNNTKEDGKIISSITTEEEQAAKEILDAFEGVGISGEQAQKLFSDENVSNLVSDFVSEAIASKLDDSVEIHYPTADELTDVVFENKELVSETFDLGQDISNLSKEELKEVIGDDYELIIGELENFVNGLGGEQ